MPTLTIEERIQVSAPPARVWAFLLDPARVAPCLPGAKLDGQEGENTFLGTMKVKVGPVTMDFKGKATMTEIHEAERRVVMIGTGNDKGGSGSAKMSMESRIIATEDGGSEIVVTADVDLAGKLMSFGRGMMGGISKQLFKQFAERVRVELGKEEPEEVPEAPPSHLPVAPAPAEEAAPAKPADEARAPESPVKKPSEEPEPAPDAAPIVVTEASEPAVASSRAEEERAVESAPKAPPVEASKAAPVEKAAPSATKPAAKKKPSTAIVPEDNAPLSAGGLVFAALWDWIKGLFRRIFGGRKAP
jgi:carbon monoxide dehydrogenase subunit G